MNALTKVKLINELNEREAELGVTEKVSWHAQYKDSAWIFLGGLPYELTEGDIICVFSQYGEIVNINLVRDKKTGKSKGFSFLCYEDQRSTILAVDNLNGIKIRGRTIRVDHVANYRPPKDSKMDDVTRTLREKGCGGVQTLPPSSSESSEDETPVRKHNRDKARKQKDNDVRMSIDKQEMAASSPVASQHGTRTEKEGAGFRKSTQKGCSPEAPQRRQSLSGSPELPRGQLEKAGASSRDSRKAEPAHKKKSFSSASREEQRQKAKSKHRDRSRSAEKGSHPSARHSEGRTKMRREQSRSVGRDGHSRDREPCYSSPHRSSGIGG
ncbi:RNA-binding motif protein, X-linked 2-like [Dromiciops gliroides]|uniref:RNA-binding motif protein, X-linked 2-like n=1 Tax=Dromiciops gliroides TaxID=33562 RepID=UPI001CC4A6AD|nr:RNA-binding motif protein, X-linked 2-like [Dromiciops gliroides]